MKHFTIIMLAAVALVLSSDILVFSEDAPAKGNMNYHATIDGRKVRLAPSGATLEIPQLFLDWHKQFENNLHLSRAELDKVEHGAGEWDTEYAQVVNAVLPFSHCAAHVGGEGWGRDAVSFADLQMRAYVMDLPAQEVTAKVLKEGAAAAKELSKEVKATEKKDGKWDVASLDFDLFFGDYGGTAGMDVYSQTIGMRTYVLVFMAARGTRGSESIAGILKSFAVEP